ncbi:hypothetical protein Ami103574_12140 [Aminipila butyrica]|uniref:Uncharacterized protein n=1 Tax=Aminipila butyrica TaxID=433296 RepID=A0A858BVC3_9FIRM|nr:hypothetical protein [Aminipila butyrica]QIB70001.1 hypothetical protein Ami103574_12140 [Aminipila butyrica]
MEKLRNLLVVLGIMVGLLPSFLYYTQNTYYGMSFSLITTFATVGFFIAACITQIRINRQVGRSIMFPCIFIGGFVVLVVYVIYRFI